MSDERPRRSWKEIDQMRDGSRRKDERERAPTGGPRSQRSYRAALDRAFNSGAVGQLVREKDEESGEEIDETKANLIAAINDAEDRPSITKAVDEYYEQYQALPNDPDALAKAVQHKKSKFQLEAMERLLEIAAERPPRRVRALLGQLRFIRDTADDPELETVAQQLLDLLE